MEKDNNGKRQPPRRGNGGKPAGPKAKRSASQSPAAKAGTGSARTGENKERAYAPRHKSGARPGGFDKPSRNYSPKAGSAVQAKPRMQRPAERNPFDKAPDTMASGRGERSVGPAAGPGKGTGNVPQKSSRYGNKSSRGAGAAFSDNRNGGRRSGSAAFGHKTDQSGSFAGRDTVSSQEQENHGGKRFSGQAHPDNNRMRSPGTGKRQDAYRTGGASKRERDTDGRPSYKAPRGETGRRNRTGQGDNGRTAMQKQSGKRYTTRSRSDKYEDRNAADAAGRQDNIVTGRIQGNANGFAFLIRDDGMEDLYLSPRHLHNALHGDKVRARLISNNRGGGEGEVLEIVAPNEANVIGTYVKKMGEKGFVVPDDQRINRDIVIESRNSKGAVTGDKVVVKLFERNGKFFNGKIEEVLGSASDIGIDVLSIIRSFGLYETFGKEVQNEASRISPSVSDWELPGRTDFRDTLVITIDGDDSKDFDDAVSVIKNAQGNYELSVHIADVAHYVKQGAPLDKEAFKRGTSVYFSDRVLPMLPENLSNGICSLNEHVDRLTLSVVMVIDPNGALLSHTIAEGVIRSACRQTYSKVARILEGDAALKKQYKDLVPMLHTMQKLAEILFKKREARGAIEFNLPECKILYDAEGNVTDLIKAPRLISHKIIEEFMLLTNETVAKHMFDIKAPFVYRVHTAPSSEKTEHLTDFLLAMGISFEYDGEQPAPLDYKNLLANIEQPLQYIVNRVALRSMSKAAYEPECRGHFGLAAEFYCHFTSPIRRYPDLLIHRIIKDYLKNGQKNFSKYKAFVVEASQQSSVTERQAEEAERAVDELEKAKYMQDKIGLSYDGLISGVTEWGIFVELENTVEGLVRMERLPGGRYLFNALRYTLTNPSYVFRLGDAVRITVLSVSGDKIEFGLAENIPQEA